jgi:hypothetical protein
VIPPGTPLSSFVLAWFIPAISCLSLASVLKTILNGRWLPEK